ncbi:hypothetical protein K445DRAFT_315468 [Daldinia sp. EC12]|nr:hypothetical protein K445DRAFT_315468 [Daldinia sp. EC12]
MRCKKSWLPAASSNTSQIRYGMSSQLLHGLQHRLAICSRRTRHFPKSPTNRLSPYTSPTTR